MDPISIVKRHGATHFANIHYGYYVLFISIVYLAFLTVLRKLVKNRPCAPSSSRWRKLLQQLYSVDPGIHLAIIWIPLLIPFYHKYSLFKNATVYIMRLGRLSYILLTLNLLLNIRPNFLFRGSYTYTDFIPLHKWLSRLIVLVATVHGILFFVFWAVDETKSISDKLHNYQNIIGVIIAGMMIILIFFSAGPMRRWNYNVFYVMHNLVSLSMIFLTAIHARPSITFPYLLINLMILGYEAFLKVFYSRRSHILGKIHDYKNTNLVNVHLPRSAFPESFEPGCHIRISPYRKLNPLYWLLPSHPYTVASLPSDSKVDLILTENKHPRSFELHEGIEYTINGQFDPAIPRDCFQTAKRVCIVCGGSGISFGLPLYRFFKKEHPIEFLQLVWIVKNKYQLKVLENLANTFSLEENSGFHVYITGRNDEPEPLSPTEEPDLEFELQSLTNEQLDENGALVKDTDTFLNSRIQPESCNFGRRLDWATDLSHFVERSERDNTWLLACGPRSLTDSAKKYAAENGIHFAAEIYAL